MTFSCDLQIQLHLYQNMSETEKLPPQPISIEDSWQNKTSTYIQKKLRKYIYIYVYVYRYICIFIYNI